MAVDYENHLKQAALDYARACKRCGACCGARENDPCSQLKKTSAGVYHCAVYEQRLGIQRTVSGKEFSCVPIRDILFESWAGSWQCAYKK